MEKVNENVQIGGQETKKSLLFNAVFQEIINENDDKIKSIVLTGGPKGGKTTSIPAIKESLENEGFTVIVVGETATEYIENNFKPSDKNEEQLVSLYDFQEAITITQVLKEMVATFKARKTLQVTDRVVVLYDRAVPDGGAYIDDETFFGILSKVGNFTLEEIYQIYDLIIHFVSTAKDKKDVFLAGQNEDKETKRIEDGIKATVDLEDRTNAMYPLTLNKVVIGNNCTFEEKTAIAIDAILECVKKDTKTIRIKETDFELLEKIKNNKDATHETIEVDNQRRFIINEHGHTYILGEYQDGSYARTLEMMKDAPVPSWILDHEEIAKVPPKKLARYGI